MRIIVSDSSCLIDLRKASLLDAFLGLPFEVLIPNTLFEGELLKFSEAEKKGMLDAGLKVVDIPGTGVLRARDLMGKNPHISLHDCFAFVLAEMHPGCILLTGDRRLRAVASASTITVHGVLWVLDQIHQNGLSTKVCHEVLVGWSTDRAVRLPAQKLAAAIKCFAELLSKEPDLEHQQNEGNTPTHRKPSHWQNERPSRVQSTTQQIPPIPGPALSHSRSKSVAGRH